MPHHDNRQQQSGYVCLLFCIPGVAQSTPAQRANPTTAHVWTYNMGQTKHTHTHAHKHTRLGRQCDFRCAVWTETEMAVVLIVWPACTQVPDQGLISLFELCCFCVGCTCMGLCVLLCVVSVYGSL